MKKAFLTVLPALALATMSAWAQNIPHGQYSGICHVKGPVYAVVHDKAQGGGLYAFVMNFTEDGLPEVQNVFELEGTLNGADVIDCEDVICTGDAHWVSAEADQSIREYDLSGYPTGRMLKIPKDLQNPTDNRGFESLAYDGTRLWTTTETPLPGSQNNIIQSFSLNTLSPSGRWLYRMDEPLADTAQASAAQAYVHGISAMTALPGGTLAVLEREVYVPSGGFWAKLTGSFTITRIYEVNPVASARGTLLEKKLITSFRTGALDLANFEGMCVLPTSAEEKTALLLIADSQDGSGGLTSEYLRVIIL